jgi:predicted transcriptional regulator
MDVLVSIKPEYAEKIFSGEKKYEYRRAIWTNEPDSVFIYETKPVGKITGNFRIGRIICETPEKIWNETMNKSGILKEDFFKYFEGVDKGYAIEILEVEKCLPVGLDIFNLKSPPQSFCYVNAD